MNTAERTQPKKRTLNEIVEELRRLLHTADDNQGEILPELEDELRNCEDSLVDKVDRCLWVNKEILAQAEVYAERAKALEDRSRVLKAQAERLKNHVHASMLALGIKTLETPHFRATIAETAGSVVIDDPEKFIAQHLKTNWVREKYEIDKTVIKNSLQLGFEVPGAKIVKSTSLRVK